MSRYKNCGVVAFDVVVVDVAAAASAATMIIAMNTFLDGHQARLSMNRASNDDADAAMLGLFLL